MLGFSFCPSASCIWLINLRPALSPDAARSSAPFPDCPCLAGPACSGRLVLYLRRFSPKLLTWAEKLRGSSSPETNAFDAAASPSLQSLSRDQTEPRNVCFWRVQEVAGRDEQVRVRPLSGHEGNGPSLRILTHSGHTGRNGGEPARLQYRAVTIGRSADKLPGQDIAQIGKRPEGCRRRGVVPARVGRCKS